MDQPLEANFFPGILEGLAGRLSLMPPGVADPPTSAKAGMSQQWAAALREAVVRTEGRDIDLEQVTHNVMPPGLHLDYGLDFLTRRVDDIAHISSHLLYYLASLAIFINSRGQTYPESQYPSRWMRACGVMAGPLLSQVHLAHLMMVGWSPRCKLMKGRPWRIGPMTKERGIRISLSPSLTQRK